MYESRLREERGEGKREEEGGELSMVEVNSSTLALKALLTPTRQNSFFFFFFLALSPDPSVERWSGSQVI